MTLTDKLDQIQARADAATGGEWWDSVVSASFHPGADYNFVVAAREDVPALVAALRAVLDLCERDDEYPSSPEAAVSRRYRSAIESALGGAE